MATKGDKSRLEPIAIRMYADGQTLTEIEAALGVSRQTLSTWKADTKRPEEELDGWDKARRQRSGAVMRIRALFDREMGFLEDLPAGQMPPASIDSLTKLGALVERWEKMAAAARKRAIEEAADTVGASAKLAGVSDETIAHIRRDVLRMAE